MTPGSDIYPPTATNPDTGERRQYLYGAWRFLPPRPSLDIESEMIAAQWRPYSKRTPGALGYIFGYQALRDAMDGPLCYRDWEHATNVIRIIRALDELGDDPEVWREFATALEPDTAAIVCAIVAHAYYGRAARPPPDSIFHEV